MESSPLEVKTNSVSGSDQYVELHLFTTRDVEAGKITIRFGSTPDYRLGFCTTAWSNFQTIPPTTSDKIWRLTVTRIPDIRVKIHCNGVEMANTLISESLCTSNTQWKVYWTKGIGKIKFHVTDDASDYYRAYTGNQHPVSYFKLVA